MVACAREGRIFIVRMKSTDFLEAERLRAFVAVAETRSFTRAAERLHLTQPAVSVQIRRLEESVGQTLFTRDSQTVRLTGAGEVMLGFARELLEVLGRAAQQLAQPLLEGAVRLGLIDDYELTVLLETLARLRGQHARFELTTVVGLTCDLLRRLEAGNLDLVLAKRVAGANHGELLCRQQLVWVGQPDVLDDAGSSVPLVLSPPGTPPREIMLQSLRAAGRRWSARFESPSIFGRRAGVLAGLGVTAFGVGMVPAGVLPLPAGLLPPLAAVEFILAQNSQSTLAPRAWRTSRSSARAATGTNIRTGRISSPSPAARPRRSPS